VNVAFTLPPGAYATLVVKRLFHWTLEAPRSRARPAPPPRAPEPRKRTGFLAKRREQKAAREQRRADARKGR
jgi:tRNA pseudouridine13 synthase